jgi:hypothetical protein
LYTSKGEAHQRFLRVGAEEEKSPQSEDSMQKLVFIIQVVSGRILQDIKIKYLTL